MATELTPDWIVAELEVGRTGLQGLLDTTPSDRAAVRTVAGSGDFRTVEGQVRHVALPSPAM